MYTPSEAGAPENWRHVFWCMSRWRSSFFFASLGCRPNSVHARELRGTGRRLRTSSSSPAEGDTQTQSPFACASIAPYLVGARHMGRVAGPLTLPLIPDTLAIWTVGCWVVRDGIPNHDFQTQSAWHTYLGRDHWQKDILACIQAVCPQPLSFGSPRYSAMG